jgi:hypothetical protein
MTYFFYLKEINQIRSLETEYVPKNDFKTVR